MAEVIEVRRMPGLRTAARPGRLRRLGAGAALLAAVVLGGCANTSQPASLLVVLGPAGAGAAAERGAGTAIVRVALDAGVGRPVAILEGYFEVGAPSVSYDGRSALFAGRREAGDQMQIWELPVSGSSARLLIADGDCHDPAYLPDGRIVYARAARGAGADAASSLYTARSDGSGQSRITFGETSRDRAAAVLADGRILFRRTPVAGQGPGKLLTVNPDGTGVAVFSEPTQAASIESGPWLLDDRAFFAESLSGGQQRLVSVSVRQPSARRAPAVADEPRTGARRFASVSLAGDAAAVAVAYATEAGWALRALEAGAESRVQQIVSALAADAARASLRPTAVALAAPRRRPLNLTSVVDPSKATGTLLCLDVNTSRLRAVSEARPREIRAVRVLTATGATLGEAAVESDGSFFIEVPADTPLWLELIGPDGVLAAERSGLWVRPNENRGCIGCHENPELAPENRVPLALAHAATVIGTAAAVGHTDVTAAGIAASQGHAP